jgi:SAM-dependent methyltransferase
MGNSIGAQRGLLYEPLSRNQKAEKIWAALRPVLSKPATQLKLLDVGCSAGIIANHLAHYFGHVYGIDLDPIGLAYTRYGESRAFFARANTDALPFGSEEFDVIICTQVYEHVSSQEALAREIDRVLKPEGIIFFSGPNKYAIMEDHYRLPFLSWLPRRLANVYVSITRQAPVYEEAPLSLGQLRRLWNRFLIHDLTATMIKHPAQFGLEREVGRMRWMTILPSWFIQWLQPFYPNYNWVLQKSVDKQKKPALVREHGHHTNTRANEDCTK